MYKVDDRVVFVEPFELTAGMEPDENGDYAFTTCDVTPEMLEELGKWHSQDILSVDEDGDLKFYDFGWTWPVEVVARMAVGDE